MTKRLCSADTHTLEIANDPNNQGPSSIDISLNDLDVLNTESLESDLSQRVEGAFPNVTSDSLESCDEEKANERNGREGEGGVVARCRHR